MAQHDYVIANGTGAAVRSDLNNALAAIVSQNSGPVAPPTTYAYMPWADTGSSPPVFKIRNAANNGWITLYELDGTFSVEAGSASSPGLYFTGDINTGIYSPGADQFGISTGGTSRLVIDASGNINMDSGTVYVDAANNRLGIGSNSPSGQLDVAGSLGTFRVGTSGAEVFFTRNENNDFRANGGSSAAISIGGQSHVRFLTGSGFDERARIDSSGRLLVGTSTAGAGTSGITVQGSPGLFTLQRDATPSGAGTSLGTINFSNTAPGTGAQISCESDAAWGSNDYPGRLVFSTTADGASSPTERMRISNDGRIAINSTTSGGNYIVYLTCASGTGGMTIKAFNTSTNYPLSFENSSGTQVGTISVTTTATAYNTSSDYRLKENVVPLTGAVDRLSQLQVHRFNFIADPDRTVDGFIAHEAQAVVPECVNGIKDAVDDDGNPIYQGIDQSKLVPLLTAALQETIAELQALKAEVAALKAS